MPPMNPEPGNARNLKELADFQSAMVDKASTYTKLIMGLGYGGFFVVWSGTKAHLSPKLLVASALLVTVSLVLYIIFEVCHTLIRSSLSIELTNTMNKPGAEVSDAFQTSRTKELRLNTRLGTIWKIVFPVSVLTGLAGAGILIYAFVASLFRMWA